MRRVAIALVTAFGDVILYSEPRASSPRAADAPLQPLLTRDCVRMLLTLATMSFAQGPSPLDDDGNAAADESLCVRWPARVVEVDALDGGQAYATVCVFAGIVAIALARSRPPRRAHALLCTLCVHWVRRMAGAALARECAQSAAEFAARADAYNPASVRGERSAGDASGADEPVGTRSSLLAVQRAAVDAIVAQPDIDAWLLRRVATTVLPRASTCALVRLMLVPGARARCLAHTAICSFGTGSLAHLTVADALWSRVCRSADELLQLLPPVVVASPSVDHGWSPESVHRLRLAIDAVTASLREVRAPDDASVVVPTRVLDKLDAAAAAAGVGSSRELAGRAIIARGCCWVLVPAPLFGVVVVAELRLSADTASKLALSSAGLHSTDERALKEASRACASVLADAVGFDLLASLAALASFVESWARAPSDPIVPPSPAALALRYPCLRGAFPLVPEATRARVSTAPLPLGEPGDTSGAAPRVPAGTPRAPRARTRLDLSQLLAPGAGASVTPSARDAQSMPWARSTPLASAGSARSERSELSLRLRTTPGMVLTPRSAARTPHTSGALTERVSPYVFVRSESGAARRLLDSPSAPPNLYSATLARTRDAADASVLGALERSGEHVAAGLRLLDLAAAQAHASDGDGDARVVVGAGAPAAAGVVASPPRVRRSLFERADGVSASAGALDPAQLLPPLPRPAPPPGPPPPPPAPPATAGPSSAGEQPSVLAASMRGSTARRRGFVPLSVQPPAGANVGGGVGSGFGDVTSLSSMVPSASTAFRPLRAVPPNAVDATAATPAKPLPHTRMVVPPTVWPPA